MATVNAAWLDFQFTRSLEQERGFQPFVPIGTTTSKLRLVIFSTALNISGQISTSNSSSRKAWVRAREAFSSEENSRECGHIVMRLVFRQRPHKLRSTRNPGHCRPRNDAPSYLSTRTCAAGNLFFEGL